MWGLFFLFLVPGSSGLRCYFCTTPKGDICDGTTAVSQMDCFGGLDNLLKAFLPQTDNVCLNFEAEGLLLSFQFLNIKEFYPLR